jgi:hypothetical protein
VIIVIKIITERERETEKTKCWNAFLRSLFRHTRKLINCFKKDTFRNLMLFITSISPETKLITVGQMQFSTHNTKFRLPPSSLVSTRCKFSFLVPNLLYFHMKRLHIEFLIGHLISQNNFQFKCSNIFCP